MKRELKVPEVAQPVGEEEVSRLIPMKRELKEIFSSGVLRMYM